MVVMIVFYHALAHPYDLESNQESAQASISFPTSYRDMHVDPHTEAIGAYVIPHNGPPVTPAPPMYEWLFPREDIASASATISEKEEVPPPYAP